MQAFQERGGGCRVRARGSEWGEDPLLLLVQGGELVYLSGQSHQTPHCYLEGCATKKNETISARLRGSVMSAPGIALDSSIMHVMFAVLAEKAQGEPGNL